MKARVFATTMMGAAISIATRQIPFVKTSISIFAANSSDNHWIGAATLKCYLADLINNKKGILQSKDW